MITQDMVGKRVLVRHTGALGELDNPREVRVVALAPSQEWVKVRDTGGTLWESVSALTVVEELEETEQQKTGKQILDAANADWAKNRKPSVTAKWIIRIDNRQSEWDKELDARSAQVKAGDYFTHEEAMSWLDDELEAENARLRAEVDRRTAEQREAIKDRLESDVQNVATVKRLREMNERLRWKWEKAMERTRYIYEGRSEANQALDYLQAAVALRERIQEQEPTDTAEEAVWSENDRLKGVVSELRDEIAQLREALRPMVELYEKVSRTGQSGSTMATGTYAWMAPDAVYGLKWAELEAAAKLYGKEQNDA